jgi:hypothetical protein
MSDPHRDYHDLWYTLSPNDMTAFAETYGLELHQLTPDFPALEDFITHRYNFWTDDVEHADPFKP